MIEITNQEHLWLICCLSQGLVDFLGVDEPPIPLENLLHAPPEILKDNLNLLESGLSWLDATFARTLRRSGTIFVNPDLPPDQRRFSIARELLAALVTSEHGVKLGLGEIISEDIRHSANYFAMTLLTPCPMVKAYRENGGKLRGFAEAFGIPAKVAARRWEEPLLCYSYG